MMISMAQNSAEPQGASEELLRTLMAQLCDSSQDVYGAYIPGRGEFAPRWQALAGLVKLGGDAVEPLCHALQDPNGYTRRFAAEALRRIGDRRAVAPLLQALLDSEVYVQRYVADALAVVGDERAAGPLYHALQHPAIAHEALLALQAVLQRAAARVPTDTLRLVAELADDGTYVAEVPNTDDGYLSWEQVEHWLDYRPIKTLAEQALAHHAGQALDDCGPVSQ